jgi:uncharacterized protein (TIGR02246 family)
MMVYCSLSRTIVQIEGGEPSAHNQHTTSKEATAMRETRLPTPGVTEEEQAIHTTVMAVEESWNRHNMDAFAELLTEDVEWINPVGMWWRGKAHVKAAHQAYHERFFRDISRYSDAITIQRLTPDVAIAIGAYHMSDYATPDDRVWTDAKDRVTYVLVKQHGRWLIVRGHVTNIDPTAAPFDPISQEERSEHHG